MRGLSKEFVNLAILKVTSKNFEIKGKNKNNMIEITFSPALQTSFSNFAIKSKGNIESATDELIFTITQTLQHIFFTYFFFIYIHAYFV